MMPNWIDLEIPSRETLTGKLYQSERLTQSPTLILLHGMMGTQKNEDIAIACQQMGWNVFMLNFPGIPGCPGKFNINIQYKDVISAIQFLVKNQFIDPAQINILGYSLGSRAGIYTAWHFRGIRTLIILSGISKFISADMTDEYANNITPLLGITNQELKNQWKILSETTQPVDIIPKLVNTKLVFIHGDKDQDVPLDHAYALHRAAIQSQLYIINDANHEYLGVREKLLNIIGSIIEHGA